MPFHCIIMCYKLQHIFGIKVIFCIEKRKFCSTKKWQKSP
ncbi:hypothetical protein CLOSTMETH_00207 [[Clostridium] methylpentosum DSM 5476]|uniref:Uncharacterized protein n=1 Tax=[Clostridium] methylpentosum DSM 5476 TaxID=537013 RepID=C0E8R2_9FIRM|nr:hypothetical protein CLOSTMETH_00207 [[Clostridium] methylpentosum DSM 5476]